MKVNNNLIGEMNNYKLDHRKENKQTKDNKIIVEDKLDIKSRSIKEINTKEFNPKEVMAQIKEALMTEQNMNVHDGFDRESISALLEE